MHELLSCDWLISNLCYQALEQVYLIKCLVSECVHCTDALDCVYAVFFLEKIILSTEMT